jgi:hypothetical protein
MDDISTCQGLTAALYVENRRIVTSNVQNQPRSPLEDEASSSTASKKLAPLGHPMPG